MNDKFKKTVKPRSVDQNHYYWSQVVGRLAKQLDKSPKEIHQLIKTNFLKRTVKKKVGKRWVDVEETGSTTNLSTVQFEDLMTKVRSWASQDHKIEIPKPNEPPFNPQEYA